MSTTSDLRSWLEEFVDAAEHYNEKAVLSTANEKGIDPAIVDAHQRVLHAAQFLKVEIDRRGCQVRNKRIKIDLPIIRNAAQRATEEYLDFAELVEVQHLKQLTPILKRLREVEASEKDERIGNVRVETLEVMGDKMIQHLASRIKQSDVEPEPVGKGVGIIDVAKFVIDRGWENQIKVASKLAKQWTDKSKKCKPEKLGMDPEYMSRPIYKVSEAMKYCQPFLNLDSDERKALRQYLIKVARIPI